MEIRQVKKLTDSQMFQYQVINKWKPQKDVWPFLYGDQALGILSAFGGLFTTHSFRKELKLRPYARLTCYSPAVGLTAIGCTIFQSVVITADLLQGDNCPLCIITKASIAQGLFGVGFPLLIAPIVCFYVADKLLTYPVPPLSKAPGEVFRLFKKIIQKNPRPYMVMGVINILAASFVVYQKQKTLHNIGYNFKGKDKK